MGRITTPFNAVNGIWKYRYGISLSNICPIERNVVEWETDSPSTDSQHGDICQAIIRIWWARIMEQFGQQFA